MNKIYLDMDGVVCNFMKAYSTIDLPDTPRKFRHAVSHLRIFENLEWMPNGKELVQRLIELDIPVEILSSRGTHDDSVGEEGIRQKNLWLDREGITFPRNFVRVGEEKRNYSTQGTLLIDDTPKVIDSFNLGQGHAFLYEDSKFSEYMQKLEMHIWQL
jgi:hypothetical protein